MFTCHGSETNHPPEWTLPTFLTHKMWAKPGNKGGKLWISLSKGAENRFWSSDRSIDRSSEVDSIKRPLPKPGHKGTVWAECSRGRQWHGDAESVLHTIFWWSTYGFLWFCPLSWLKFRHVYTATQNKWKHSLFFTLGLADIIMPPDLHHF